MTKYTSDFIIAVASKRIKTLEDLLVCYRLGKRPSEKLFSKLYASEKAWEKLFKQKGE